MPMIEVEFENRITWIYLNRPDKRNALSQELVLALTDEITFQLTNDACRLIVIGARGTSFCSGADLESILQLQTNSFDENLADSQLLRKLFQLIFESPKPIISMVHGAAFAGGCGLASLTDFCFASKDAKFAYTEVKIGFIPALVMVFLKHKIAGQHLRNLLYTGQIISAQQAYEIGLISHLADDNIALKEQVAAFANQFITQTSGNSFTLTKKLLLATNNLNLNDALDIAAKTNAHARSTDDCKKGIHAFINKIKLTW
jgi:methylglutaconyl-CoA hydratase